VLSSDGSVLFSGSELGIVMRNAFGGTGGNDHAFDDIRLLDVTPQLGKSFTPDRTEVDGSSVLTLTITNTDDLLAKEGWPFTDTLPAGLTLTTPADARTDCAAGTVHATDGGSSIGITGGALYRRGRLVPSARAGVGAPDDPTPVGHFYVAFDQPAPAGETGYGPFIVVTSAHSEAISDWAGSGDAVVGIRGPLGEDGRIGTAGARISHGCIRLHDRSLRRLKGVPPGTPIDVLR
jgi:hypothetical protein